MDALYKTKDSKELPSDSKLPRTYEDIDDSEIESLAGLTNQPREEIDQDEDEVNINEEVGVNVDEEAGVNKDEQDNPVDISEAGIVSDSKVDDNDSRNDLDNEPEHDELENNEHDENDREESNGNPKETLEDSESKNTSQIWHPKVLNEIEDHLQGGEYWAMAAATVTEFNKMEASLDTPQYGFNKGLKLFGRDGYKATVKELLENLLDRGAVEMIRSTLR